MYKSIGMDEFYQKVQREELAIVDVRETDEFAFGHIPNATNAPLSEFNLHLDSFQPDKEYYIICQSGGRSAMASEFLGNNGYTVTNVLGGMSAWKGALDGNM